MKYKYEISQDRWNWILDFHSDEPSVNKYNPKTKKVEKSGWNSRTFYPTLEMLIASLLNKIEKANAKPTISVTNLQKTIKQSMDELKDIVSRL